MACTRVVVRRRTGSVNIFEVDEDRFRSGRIYTELVRDAGGVEQQLERMTQGTAPPASHRR